MFQPVMAVPPAVSRGMIPMIPLLIGAWWLDSTPLAGSPKIFQRSKARQRHKLHRLPYVPSVAPVEPSNCAL